MAIISESLAWVWSYLPPILVTIAAVHFTRNYFKAGLVSVPGPLLAKVTNAWRFIDVAKGRAEVTLHGLHRKHGDYVRLGPSVVSVRNLDALKTIYGINKGYRKVGITIFCFKCSVDFAKTDFYRVQQQLAKGRPTPTLFTTTDEDFHAAIKRPISSAYSMSTLTEFEPFVDKTIYTFFEKLDGYVAETKVCDIAAWLQYCE